MKFNENLRNLRKEKDLSQDYLAAKLNVSRQTISKWENGSAMPNLSKLIELAEFFEVSMDTLLGMEFNSVQNEETADITKYEQYANQLAAVIDENQRKETNKKIKNIIIVFAILIIAIVIIFISKANDLNNQIMNLQNQVNGYISQSENNFAQSEESGPDDYISCKLLNIDNKQPHIAAAEFKYTPESYAKDLKVYFIIPQADNKDKKIEAKSENGEFVLKTDIDLSLNKSYYIFTDDGTTVLKHEIFPDFDEQYKNFTAFDYYYCNFTTGDQNEFRYTNDFNSDLKWKDGISAEIVSAELIAECDSKILYREKLNIKKEHDSEYDTDYAVHLPDFSFKTKYIGAPDVYIHMVDKNSVEYKYYPAVESDSELLMDDSSKNINNGNSKHIIFTIEGKKYEIKEQKEEI